MTESFTAEVLSKPGRGAGKVPRREKFAEVAVGTARAVQSRAKA
jgi:hypothetical protein